VTIEKRTADLPTLADRVNAEHRACEEAVGAALSHAINAGELLTEAKAGVPHGSWGAWLADNFEGSERTAQAYMKLYRRRDEIRNGAADLSLRGALKALSAPKGEEPVDEEVAGAFGAGPGQSPADINEGLRVARALIEVRDSGIYAQAGYATFEGYLEGRWGISPDTFGLWESLAAMPEQERLGHEREYAIYGTVFSAAWGRPEDRPKWEAEIDRLERVVRPVDIPPSRERSSLEDRLTYRQMHRTIAELVEGGEL
jgi:hypothetical protein